MEKIANFEENNGENLLSKNKDVIKNNISNFDEALNFEDNYSEETSTIAFIKFIKEVFPKFIASRLEMTKNTSLKLHYRYDILTNIYQNKPYLIFKDAWSIYNVAFTLPIFLPFEEARRVVEYINTFLMDYNIGRILSNENGTSVFLYCSLQDIKNAYYMELQRLEYLTNPQQTKCDR